MLEAEKLSLQRQHEAALAHLYGIEGAIQLCDALLEKLKGPADGSGKDPR